MWQIMMPLVTVWLGIISVAVATCNCTGCLKSAFIRPDEWLELPGPSPCPRANDSLVVTRLRVASTNGSNLKIESRVNRQNDNPWNLYYATYAALSNKSTQCFDKEPGDVIVTPDVWPRVQCLNYRANCSVVYDEVGYAYGTVPRCNCTNCTENSRIPSLWNGGFDFFLARPKGCRFGVVFDRIQVRASIWDNDGLTRRPGTDKFSIETFRGDPYEWDPTDTQDTRSKDFLSNLSTNGSVSCFTYINPGGEYVDEVDAYVRPSCDSSSMQDGCVIDYSVDWHSRRDPSLPSEEPKAQSSAAARAGAGFWGVALMVLVWVLINLVW